MIKNIERQYVFLDPTETQRFGALLSLWAKPGHIILLNGDLGTGKSTFARAFIAALAKGGEEFDIPSPSFSLVQAYENTRVPVAHIDLYRLSSEVEVDELGINELLQTHIVLVEWPDKLGELSTPTLKLQFSGSGNTRTIDLKANSTWCDALNRNDKIEQFLATTAWKNSPRIFLEGDASSRRYETLTLDGKPSILMDMPQKPDGPIVQDGKPYSAIAHLAEGIGSVISVNQQLLSQGYSAPFVEISDQQHGLAILENLGNSVFGTMIKSGADMREPMETAVAVLADMVTKTWPSNIPTYDSGAQLIEADLLVSWFWPFVHGKLANENLHVTFGNIWRELLPLATSNKPHWVLRDFHSPNLIWIPNRKGLKRIGLIDTQDAVLGHPAYDLASLLQDARVDIDFAWADELYRHYENLRYSSGDFDKDKFAIAYAILGAQRATKILGIFARLAKRDGKPAYLAHMPRVSRYLKRNLEHASLFKLKTWYEENMPEALSVA